MHFLWLAPDILALVFPIYWSYSETVFPFGDDCKPLLLQLLIIIMRAAFTTNSFGCGVASVIDSMKKKFVDFKHRQDEFISA